MTDSQFEMGKFALIILVLLLGIVVGWISNERLSSKGTTSSIPEKPSTVPESAIWAGGSDGGMWVSCNKSNLDKLECQIFADVTGVLVEESTFAIQDKDFKPVFYSNGLLEFKARYKSLDFDKN
ncbi:MULTISPECIES: hypothetical protein [Alteromonas]|jgi:hypothetical protein|uniref:hypothetical protein n=2 Tax=Gammaproteobacteria TaxID=1236 RepID=UPI000C3599D0|nr:MULTISPECIES: hypothetical protein [Alteromonas]MAB91904.1 hypothetical protein [Alteromonas sp.]MBU32540.1 hypothetical protein [Alteromonas sp.]QPL49208.1 hypothetical protein IUA53_15380 [Alteromonas sp. B31-7]|tara:strand:+ start:62 stop:433 length:372 start_codon:yes stop_codon:yes gene_type:complete